MPSVISRLGASASDYKPYEPFFAPSIINNHGHQQSNDNLKWQPYSKQVDRWLQRSKNQRRKQNKKHPPPQSPFLPPTLNNLVVPAPPQPATFNDNSEYLDTWMNMYNPYISSSSFNNNNGVSKFNYNGDFYGWCKKRGLGASAPCA